MQDLKEKIIEKVKMEQEISPFLFVSENLELLNQKIYSLSQEILEYFEIPKVNIFSLKDNWEKIKLNEIKNFLQITDSNTPYKIQIIIIENFARANLQSQNSCLKKLEEPGKKNLFFLTSQSEAWILDTILSRVQTIKIDLKQTKIENNFFLNLLDEAIFNKNIQNLISYFFKNKLEKQDYIEFLETLIEFSKKNMIFIDFLEEIFDDLNMIKSNNVFAKYIVDKWILKIINNE